MKATVLIAAVLVAMLCSTAAWTQGGPGAGGPPPPGCPVGAILPPPATAVSDLTTKLTLTPQQAADLKALLTASDATLQPMMKAAGDASKALHDAISAATYDAAAMGDVAAKAEAAEAAMVASSIQTWASIRGILTGTQLTKLMAAQGGCPPPQGPPPGPPPTTGGTTSSGSTGTARTRR